MKHYTKIWLITVGVFALVFLGLLIYAGLTTDKRGTIIKLIKNLDTTKISQIEIAPSNVKWKENLTIDLLFISDKAVADNLLMSLKSLKAKHLTKGTKTFWKCYLVLYFEPSFHVNLRDKHTLALSVSDTEEGLFLELPNVMGYETYSCEELKYWLEKIASYKEPLGGDL